MIIGITGIPGTGKTTLAMRLAKREELIIHTDQYRTLPWDAQWRESMRIVESLSDISEKVYVVEGVMVGQMLHHDWNPDMVIFLEKVHGERKDNPGMNSQVYRGVNEYRDRGGLVVVPG